MKTQSDLQSKLEELFNSKNVYFQPPENLGIQYPAIIYSIRNKRSNYADDTKYFNSNSYNVIVIDKRPDNPVIDKILQLQYSSYDRHYVANNLNHDVIILYF